MTHKSKCGYCSHFGMSETSLRSSQADLQVLPILTYFSDIEYLFSPYRTKGAAEKSRLAGSESLTVFDISFKIGLVGESWKP